ncbi:Adenine DNA glycosylase [Dyadobacter sp. CECT 9275]|uniref:Adenine DNA glycosylase n=2 Tax=Dyadobacter helix TaxID=2822344 RepID=A0A916JFM6_9BACT|nr:Adenine DNA glycosylase [Dyadobacter sp. CECT 9275]
MLGDSIDVLEFNKKLKTWYLRNHRKLPWRETNDPYKIWLSEIILQQTRVAQGTPYYERFVTAYPTVEALAGADEKDVLRLWQGLGYYSRARNMHFTARQIVAEFDARFPATAVKLEKLKGLGAYTAAAIASFAFNEVVPAIDGNVYRVMARIFGIYSDILSPAGKKEFLDIARQLISTSDPATYNQAMIEFGAIQCVPVSPDCEVCPFNTVCYAYLHKVQAALPVKAKKVAVKNRYLHYFILEDQGRLALKERTGKDIWKGLYDFPGIETASADVSPEDLMQDNILGKVLEKGVLKEIVKPYIHILTHQRLNVKFWWVSLRPGLHPGVSEELSDNLSFYAPEEVETLPKPILIDNVLRDERYL